MVRQAISKGHDALMEAVRYLHEAEAALPEFSYRRQVFSNISDVLVHMAELVLLAVKQED